MVWLPQLTKVSGFQPNIMSQMNKTSIYCKRCNANCGKFDNNKYKYDRENEEYGKLFSFSEGFNKKALKYNNLCYECFADVYGFDNYEICDCCGKFIQNTYDDKAYKQKHWVFCQMCYADSIYSVEKFNHNFFSYEYTETIEEFVPYKIAKMIANHLKDSVIKNLPENKIIAIKLNNIGWFYKENENRKI